MADDLRTAMFDPSRRNFLRTSGLAAIASTLTGETSAQEQDSPRREDAGPRNGHHTGTARAIDLVNVLQGTDSTMEFSRGNTLPIAALPFGMAHWTLQTHADTPWMFQPGARRIQGFRCTHQLSPWLGDYGSAVFLPFAGEVDPEPAARASSYRPEEARLSPCSLQLFLMRYRGDAELVPTERCAALRADFDKSDAGAQNESPGLVIDVPSASDVFEPEADRRTIRFRSRAHAGGVPENFATFYVVTFARPWTKIEIKQAGSHSIAVVRFQAGDAIEAHIGTSFISFEQAALHVRREIGTATVATLREAAATRWEDHLQRVEIDGATHEQQRVFYSCMYRALLFPRIWHEPDAAGAMHHFSAFNGKVMPGVMYADHGFWDVYRAWYPFMSILFPERLGEILQAWVNASKEGGWMPQFPSPGYRACMTGSLIDSIFGDAACKGIQGFDLAAAYEGLKRHASSPGDPTKGYGRIGFEQYAKLHYVPADRTPQSVAETVDAAYGDFCIAQVAKALGKDEEYQLLLKRSENWRNVFDPEVSFFRGKNEDGSWETPFDAFSWGSPYVEGGAWQHRWDVPHNMDALIERMGGKAEAAAALEQMLALPPIFHVGVYGQEIHEMSEMAAVPFGQYAHGNQPVHHLLYIFAYAGRPDRVQFWVRRVLQELYAPDTFPGDEDTGSMSAWFLMSSLGFYQLCPGKPEYTLGSPLFPRATLHLPDQKRLIVEASGNTPTTAFVRDASLNGVPLSSHRLTHAELLRGGTLHCTMSETI
ncbi:MAG: GH92 family glycosyl hydrolase [Acidobacteriota bacterium]|nr:GH92 family glycosyl hydrolase [Acidobacteriota bacterium]